MPDNNHITHICAWWNTEVKLTSANLKPSLIRTMVNGMWSWLTLVDPQICCEWRRYDVPICINRATSTYHPETTIIAGFPMFSIYLPFWEVPYKALLQLLCKVRTNEHLAIFKLSLICNHPSSGPMEPYKSWGVQALAMKTAEQLMANAVSKKCVDQRQRW